MIMEMKMKVKVILIIVIIAIIVITVLRLFYIDYVEKLKDEDSPSSEPFELRDAPELLTNEDKNQNIAIMTIKKGGGPWSEWGFFISQDGNAWTRIRPALNSTSINITENTVIVDNVHVSAYRSETVSGNISLMESEESITCHTRYCSTDNNSLVFYNVIAILDLPTRCLFYRCSLWWLLLASLGQRGPS